MLNKIRIYLLKRQARRHYRDRMSFQVGDAGAFISDVISGGRVNYHARRFNELMDELAEIDPDTPKERLFEHHY